MKLSNTKEQFDFYRSTFIDNLKLALDVEGIPQTAITGINNLIDFFSGIDFDDNWDLNNEISLVTCKKEFDIHNFSKIMKNGMAIMARHK